VILPAGGSHSKVGTKDVSLGLDTLLQEIGLRKVLHPWHLLRHTFASHFVMRGGNLLALQKILGHSDLKRTMIYAHLAPDFLGQEMDRLATDSLRIAAVKKRRLVDRAVVSQVLNLDAAQPAA
jgi:site-specific recombinase XerD